MRPALVQRWLAPAGGGLLLGAALVLGGLVYTLGGGGARDSLVTQMLINAVVVVGIQVYVGNTGVLSFGHIGFAGIAGYVFALFAISPEQKATIIPDAPFGLADVSATPFVACLVAVGVTLVVAFVVGLGLARSGARSGAVAATVITLALLFLVHEMAVNWTELTGGDRAGLSFALGESLDGRTAVVVAVVGAVIVARLFAESTWGRLAQAAREDDLAARAVGIDPSVVQMAALLVSVVLVAVGASLRVYELGTITPRFFFFDYTLLTLTMLIVGGRKSVTGALVGVVVITAGNELTRYLGGPDVDIAGLNWILREGLSEIFLGAAMLGFMIFRSEGLLADWEVDRWVFSRWRRRHEEPPELPAPVPHSSAELEVSGMTVDFGGFRALEDVDVSADAREVLGLIGPNGAGKTTLLNAVTGTVAPAAGSCRLDDRRLTGLPTHKIARAGLVRTFQNLRLFPASTVRDHVEVAALVARSHRPDRALPTPESLLLLCDLWDHRDRRALELDYGTSRRLELARAAAAAPEFLLLDEPTSGMSDLESLAMIEVVRAVASGVGAGVIVIDHDLAFITGICDRIYCLDQGRVIAVGAPDEIQADLGVRAAYLGTATPA
jgi:branched-chain amino acid transport system permease protein